MAPYGRAAKDELTRDHAIRVEAGVLIACWTFRSTGWKPFTSMAPEQTGRMNRSIDSRSDLYALGITLYELLTRGLPFTASDPMEWAHCHIARQPLSPAERLKDVPLLYLDNHYETACQDS